MSVAERYLSYAVPPVISSSEFTTEFIEYVPSGSKRDYTSGDAFTISLANLNKAQYLLPDSCSLTFDVFATAVPNTVNPSIAGTYQTLDKVPRPLFGCPYFESCTVSVPGSADFNASPSSAEQTAAYWYSTRLLASSVTAQNPHDRGTTFRLPGRYNMAGGKSGLERAEALTGGGLFLQSDGATPLPLGVRGNALSYSIPLSAFCTLFCKSSSLIPIGMLSSGGEALVFNFTVSRDIAAVLGFDPAQPDNTYGSPFKTFAYKILNPRIVCSVVRVQNPVTVSQLSSLYDARVKMALPAPGGKSVEIAVPMVIAHKRFLWARSVIPSYPASPLNSSQPLAITFSGVNEPSVSAIVLRFRWRPTTTQASLLRRSTSGVYLGSDEPPIVLRDLQVRLNDQLIPLRGIADEGVSTIPVRSNTGTALDPITDAPNGLTLIARTSSGLASQLWELGRHGLGLYMEDDHCSSLADVVYDKDISFAQVPIVSGAAIMPRSSGQSGYTSMTEKDPFHCVGAFKSPIGLFVIPLTSFPQLVGDYSNAHTLRSWDLRSVSSFTVSGTVQVVSNGDDNWQPNAVTPNERRNSFVCAPREDVIVDGALVCDGALRLAAGSSDSRFQYSMISSATAASV